MSTGNELNDTKVIADILGKYASKAGRDVIATWNDWLSWCCGVFEWGKVDAAGGYSARFAECRDDNPLFFDAMREWMELAARKIEGGGAYDAFGTLYEANYQSSFKANSCGQFFTPSNICDLLARVSDGCSKPTDEVVRFNDCACGSGRTLLSAWNVCDKYNRNLFYAADLDSTSVYMCALNFLIHGMVGAVVKQDTLTQDWYFGFIVNACKVPFANNACCIQYFDKEDDFKRSLAGLEANARVWNCVEFRPVCETSEVEKVEEMVVEAPKEPTKPKGKYIEMDLFA